MDIGIGLPATIPNAPPELILDWAGEADAGPFSSLGIIDRLVYTNYEPLVTLAAAAGATQRIKLMTSILIAPLRNAGMLAKMAASVDALSSGRLVLGLSVGDRKVDFDAAPADFHSRGRKFESQLEDMYTIWSGQSLRRLGTVGPKPAREGGPAVLIGGYSPSAIGRLSKYGDGYISGGVGPEVAAQGYAAARQAWQAGGRKGEPRLVSGLYYALGENARERGGAYLHDYYSFLGPIADQIVDAIPVTPDVIRDVLAGYEQEGADEVVLWPTIAHLDQLERLVEALW